jgi:hypothetical protein
MLHGVSQKIGSNIKSFKSNIFKKEKSIKQTYKMILWSNHIMETILYFNIFFIGTIFVKCDTLLSET